MRAYEYKIKQIRKFRHTRQKKQLVPQEAASLLEKLLRIYGCAQTILRASVCTLAKLIFFAASR